MADIDGVTYSTAGEINSQTIVASFERTEVVGGPLPHPKLLKGYNEIIPDGAERIMAMAEKEQENRLLANKEVRDTNREIALKKLNYIGRGQIFGFILTLIMLGLATLFVFTGHEGIAYCLFTVGMVSLVGLFIQNISSKSKNKNAD